jgi:uncharacterized protein YkwD
MGDPHSVQIYRLLSAAMQLEVRFAKPQLESKKVVTEWQLGAGKLQRKLNIVENDHTQMAPANQIDNTPVAQAPASSTPAVPSQSKNWVASVQPKTPDTIERVANCFRPG